MSIFKHTFTFQTQKEFHDAEAKGYDKSYDLVVITIKNGNHNSHLPCNSLESYQAALSKYEGRIMAVYADKYMMDVIDHE